MTDLEKFISLLRDAVYKHLTFEKDIAKIFNEQDVRNIEDSIKALTKPGNAANLEIPQLFRLAQEWIQEAENEMKQLTNQL